MKKLLESDETYPKHGFSAELRTRRFWIILTIALGSLFVATAADVVRIGVQQGSIVDYAVHWFMSGKVWILVLKDVGFACLIALVLALFIERSARDRQERAAAMQQEKIAENVFKGVFNNDIPEVLVDEVVESVLRAPIVRTENHAHFIMDDGSIEVDGDITRHVVITATTRYTLKNCSRQPINVPVGLMIPIPSNPNLRARAKLTEVEIAERKLSDVEIAEGDRAIPDTAYEKRFQWRHQLSPGDTLSVKLAYSLVKDRSDNEIWTSLFPTLASTLSVVVNTGDLDIGADGLNRETLRPVNAITDKSEERHRTWELKIPMLPYQGFVLWWRPRGS